MKPKKTLIFILAIVLICAVGNRPVKAQTTAVQYKFIDLGTLGGLNSSAITINDSNQILGTSDTANGESHAFIWRNGAFRDLGQVTALDMNKQGQVLLYKKDSDGLRHAYLWEDDRLTDLHFVGNGDEELLYVNNPGQVVGHGWPRDDWSPFLLVNGELIDITPEEIRDSYPTRLNNLGQIAITTWRYGDGTSYIWTKNVLKPLKVPSGYIGADVNGLNDKGAAVGRAAQEDPNWLFTYRAILWQPDGEVVRLPTWKSYQSSANAINNRGQVIGQMRILSDPNTGAYKSKAVVWQNQTSMLALLPLPKGYKESRAVAINYNGYIVGSVTTPAGATHAVLWKPSVTP